MVEGRWCDGQRAKAAQRPWALVGKVSRSQGDQSGDGRYLSRVHSSGCRWQAGAKKVRKLQEFPSATRLAFLASHNGDAQWHAREIHTGQPRGTTQRRRRKWSVTQRNFSHNGETQPPPCRNVQPPRPSNLEVRPGPSTPAIDVAIPTAIAHAGASPTHLVHTCGDGSKQAPKLACLAVVRVTH